MHACDFLTQPDTRCPGPHGEFPPVACAVVSGVVKDRDGKQLARMGLRVDSFIPGVGYAYASNAHASDRYGRFTMIVYRINQLTPMTDPDTASVEVKLHATLTPAPRDVPLAVVLVLMNFAPLSERVEPAITDLRFPVTR
jgi:hypothetical protein